MVPSRLQTLQRLYKVIAEGIPFRCNELLGAAEKLFVFVKDDQVLQRA
jgi:hypothetical protein